MGLLSSSQNDCRKSSDILTGISSDILSDILCISPDILSDSLSGISSDSLSESLFGTSSDILSGILSNTSSDIVSGLLSGKSSASRLLFGREHWSRVIAVEVRQGTLAANGRC